MKKYIAVLLYARFVLSWERSLATPVHAQEPAAEPAHVQMSSDQVIERGDYP